MKNSERGNVLFLILIGVVLFAALSFAISKSFEGGSGHTRSERSKLDISQLLQYATQLENAVMRLQTVGPCAIEEISFDAPAATGYTNAGSPGNNSCHVFHPSGGGASYQTLVLQDGTTAQTLTPEFSAAFNIPGVLTSAADLILWMEIPSSLSSVCLAVNDTLDIPNDSATSPPVVDTGAALTKFTGTVGSAQFATPNAAISAQRTGCISNSFDSKLVFYHVLTAR